jgi:hypothetical protein
MKATMTRYTGDITGVQEFTIHAVEADIVLNRFGLHVPNSAIYVLEENLETVRQLRAGIRDYLNGVEATRDAAEAEFEKVYDDGIDAVLDAVDGNGTEEHEGVAAAISEGYGTVLDGKERRGLQRRIWGALNEDHDTDKDRQFAVKDAIDGYSPLVAVVRTQVREAIADVIDDVDDAYQDRIGRLHERLETERKTVNGLRELVDSYCDSVPERSYAGTESGAGEEVAELNPLDDAYALLEENNPKDPSVIQPLVIRANEGDRIEIEFVNHLDRPASIHQTALPYDVETSDGMAVGTNPDTTAAPECKAPDNRVEYVWQADRQGTHFFYDGANQAIDSAGKKPQEANLLARGLFGAVVVEPPEAEWTDPQTGGELRSGVRADVHDPSWFEKSDKPAVSYREFVVFYHSPVGVAPDVRWPTVPKEQETHAINYRCDPSGQRVNDEFPDTNKEELFYHSRSGKGSRRKHR